MQVEYLRWVQKKGKNLRTEEHRKWLATFEHSRVIETSSEQKDSVVTELEATMIQ